MGMLDPIRNRKQYFEQEKYLGIGFGVEDFFSFEDDNGELLLPLLVLLSCRAVDLFHDPINQMIQT